VSAHWGHLLFYLGLGALLTAEEAGVFLLPGDISMIAAGVYGAQGGPFIWFSWGLAFLGMVLGACIMFYTVRRHERSIQALPERVRGLVHRYGSWGIAAARLVPGLRNATVFAAAAAHLPPYKFLAGLIPAALAWTGLLLWVGYFGGESILSVVHRADGHPAIRAISIGLVVCAASFWLVRLRMTREREQELEEEVWLQERAQ
jgi:membrane protein DedA with SNARE-associated domain